MNQKVQKHRNNKIRAAARGQHCTLNLPGIDFHDPATVVWCHSPFIGDGGGMGTKSHDFIGCMACDKCHSLLDGRTKTNLDREFLRHRFYEAMKASLVRLYEMGIKLW